MHRILIINVWYEYIHTFSLTINNVYNKVSNTLILKNMIYDCGEAHRNCEHGGILRPVSFEGFKDKH